MPLVAARTVQYSRINPEESRDLFIRHALVEGDWDTHHEFFKANQALLQRLSELEERARRRDIVVDDEDLSPSTTRGCPRRWSRSATSTAGGRTPAGRPRSC